MSLTPVRLIIEVKLYDPLRNSILLKEYDFVFPHENSREPYPTKDKLEKSDLILAEVSFPSTGQGIELGWADMKNIPIMLVYIRGANPSKSLKEISAKSYGFKNFSDLEKKAYKYILNMF